MSSYFQNFSDRLRELTGETPLSTTLKKIDADPNWAKPYARGNLPGMDALVAIADAYGKSVDWLIGREDSTPTLARIHGSDGKQAQEFAYIKRYAARDGDPEITFAFRRRWIKDYLKAEVSNLAVVRIEDDLMAPTFQRRDNVLVDMGYQHKPGNGLYALRLEDSIVVRRTQKLSSGKLRILCENENYPPDEIRPDENEFDFEIVGKVVWFSRQI
ncbi:peptidase S24-like family protein [Burkholderia pseudomallei]|nr:S24 family peptidase [Burkholderia pseudomallei]AIS48295.1 peptidase S24-like family protein [Burkholderia pseudomallei]EET09850.1 putative repressor protein [Burkholderia pseudomallei 1710a]KGD19583.1 peptidase S24-like family protein [Burkholderia pseudomallei]CAJ4994189.1 repressor protein [Burkholderia pseudomallei]CAJ5325826.1 repressor protein [Burkholderia pseudomallei]